MNKMNASIGLVMPTLNAERHLECSLACWLRSPLHPRVLVIDSTSEDRTVEIARDMGAMVHIIPHAQFNHGTTREWARKQLVTDYVAMVTPDAYPIDEGVLENLLRPLQAGKATVSYARQIPHEGSGLFEAFPRQFNYPSESHIRGLEDIAEYGVYTFFCSNSCALYSNKALDSIGGFLKTNFGEDTLAAAHLLRNGHKIAYVAEAIVRHSHAHTLQEEFQRCADIGSMHSANKKLIHCGNVRQRGANYARMLIKYVLRNSPALLPYAIAHIAVKWIGYNWGHYGRNRNSR